MAILPSPDASRAILIGVTKYTHLEHLPSVGSNLKGLAETLADPLLWGLPQPNCKALKDPPNANVALNALQHAATEATDALIVYFAGHGLIDPENDDELYLALPDSDQERAYRTAMPYGWLRRELQRARARRKVVILDCCYSGRAIGSMGNGQEELADRLQIEGTCVLTATARTRRALAPPDQTFTAFTGELLSALRNGIPGGPALLDMDAIYRYLANTMRAKSLPLPQRGQTDHGGDIALAHNRSWAMPSTSSSGLQPTNSSEDIPPAVGEPHRPAQWLAMIDTSRKPTVEGITSIEAVSSTSRSISVIALLIWCALAGWLAYAAMPDWWMALAGFVGSASLLAVRHFDFLLRGAYAAIPMLVFYVCGALPFGTESWLVRGSVIGILILYLVVGITRLLHGVSVAQADRTRGERQRQLPLADEAKRSRWLPGTTPADSAPSMLNQLGAIPAARFASLPKGRFPYLVVAGTRVALISFLTWPPGRYTRPPEPTYDLLRDGQLFLEGADQIAKITADAAAWQDSGRWRFNLPSKLLIKTIVVIRSTNSSVGVLLHIDDVENNISFVTPDTFADVVGTFLAKEAYELNIPTIEWLKSRLEEAPAYW